MPAVPALLEQEWSEVMDDELKSDDVEVIREIVYRSVAVPLYIEDEPQSPDQERRTRVSARFDRSNYVPETFHRFEPTRSKYAQKLVNDDYNKQIFGNGKKIAITLASKAQLEALKEHGSYVLVEVYRTESGKTHVVRARCAGIGCGGQATRSFRAQEWLDLSKNNSCPRCKGAEMMAEADARYRATVKPSHGLWVFESMSRMYGGKMMAVTGVCTGPICGGWRRNFQFSHWQGDRVAMEGCHRCCVLVRAAASENDRDRGAA